MGAWGTGVFSNDAASDVRDEYRTLVAEGLSSAEATDRLLTAGEPDEDEAPDFWIGLAVTQAKLGRLEDRVRERALTFVSGDADLARWEPSHRRSRTRVLARVRDQLTAPQRQPVKLRPRPQSIAPFEPGDVLAFRTADEHQVLLVVVKIWRDKGGEGAVVAVLDWHDDHHLPTSTELPRVPVAKVAYGVDPASGRSSEGLGLILFAATRPDRTALETRVRRVGHVPSTARARTERTGLFVEWWTALDRWFEGGRVRSSGPTHRGSTS